MVIGSPEVAGAPADDAVCVLESGGAVALLPQPDAVKSSAAQVANVAQARRRNGTAEVGSAMGRCERRNHGLGSSIE